MAAENDIILERRGIVSADFESRYMALRKKEHRVYTDTELALLPSVPASHIHYDEWRIRKRSAEKLWAYLQKKNKALAVLEVGCGNGWLSAMLSTIKDAVITGTDINRTELEQAKRVFGDKPGPDFIPRDIRDPHFDDRRYDSIIFAASVQYFDSFEEIINRARALLNPGGEIHILDSFFYPDEGLQEAKKRSRDYFDREGSPWMAQHYFHHSMSVLKKFNHVFLFRPGRFSNILFARKGIFPWVCITKK